MPPPEISGVKHWHWLALGFQGLVGMMQRLDAENVPMTDDAWKLLEEQRARLQDVIDSQRAKLNAP